MEKDDIYEELEELIGPEAAQRLVDHYSGSSIYIPRSIYIKRKHRQIKEDFKNGANYRELAQRYGLSERYIRRIVHRKGPFAAIKKEPEFPF